MAQNEEFEGTEEEEADSSNAAFCRFYYGHPVSPQYHLVVLRSLSHFLQSLSTAAIKTPAKIDNLTVHDFGPEKRCRGKSPVQWVESNRNVLVVCSSFPVPVTFPSTAGPSTVDYLFILIVI